jgi:hypothetical protein
MLPRFLRSESVTCYQVIYREKEKRFLIYTEDTGNSGTGTVTAK